jgi:hypothetical protein
VKSAQLVRRVAEEEVEEERGGAVEEAGLVGVVGRGLCRLCEHLHGRPRPRMQELFAVPLCVGVSSQGILLPRALRPLSRLPPLSRPPRLQRLACLLLEEAAVRWWGWMGMAVEEEVGVAGEGVVEAVAAHHRGHGSRGHLRRLRLRTIRARGRG